MATKAGVWIDHKQAVVVLVTDAGREVRKIAFDIGQPIRSKGASKGKNPYKPDKFVAEDTLERKVENDRKDYYDDVFDAMRGADAVLILGPGEAKGELHKRLTSKKLRGVAVEVETVDKMTDRQIAAKVALHFAAPVAKKSATSRKTAKKAAKKPGTAAAKGKHAKKKLGK